MISGYYEKEGMISSPSEACSDAKSIVVGGANYMLREYHRSLSQLLLDELPCGSLKNRRNNACKLPATFGRS